jgi:hypothetical protein
VEFAKAATLRPATLRQAFHEIAAVPEVTEALFQILETQRMMAGPGKLVLLPEGPHSRALSTLLAAELGGTKSKSPA